MERSVGKLRGGGGDGGSGGVVVVVVGGGGGGGEVSVLYLIGVKNHGKIHIIKNTVMKQSSGVDGELKPIHKKTTNITTMSATLDIDSPAPTI